MARWVPDERDRLDDLISDLIAMFTGAEQRVITALAVQARAGLAKGEGPLKALRLGELRRDSQGIAQALRDAYPDEVARIAATASEWGTDAAIKEMSALADVEDLTKTARVAGSPAAQAMTADLTNALDDVTKRILRYPDDVYRQAVANNALNVTLGQATGKQAQQGAWNQLLDQRVTGFTDKAGRDWNLSSYTEMATRSATRRAWDDAKVSAMHENGIDLVSVVVGSGSCEPCARWAGKILRTNGGPTGRIKLQHATEDREVTVTVDGTLARAKSDGWRHPNCFPGWVPVESPTGIAAADSRWFEGEIIVVHTSGGRELSVTPNHPILTPNGWVAAGLLNEGDDLVSYYGPVQGVSTGGPDHKGEPAPIGEVFEALREASAVPPVFVPGAPEQFHGDGALDSEVNVVLTDGLLKSDGEPATLEQTPEGDFLVGGVRLPSLLAERPSLKVLIAAHHAANCVVSGTGEPVSLVLAGTGHADSHGGRAVAEIDTGRTQDAGNYGPGDSLSSGELIDGLAGLVSLDQVSRVERRDWSGHVYNLQSGGGWYLASNLIVHNCRCSTTAYLPGLSVITDVTTYDPEKEQERMRLRALERGVRAKKLDAARALTDDGRTTATAKARDLQTKIREHVATTGLKRQRGREQVNLDNRRA